MVINDYMKGRMENKGKNKRIGLFGGTFNPIHLGHLRGAEEIREAFDLDEIIFIPSSIPPHKVAEGVIDAKHRLEMVRLAIASNPFFTLSDVELSRPGKSYSIHTIRYFQERHPRGLHFILGRDAFVEIETWKEYQTLFSLCHFIVMARPGFREIPRSSQLPDSLCSHFRYDENNRVWTHSSGYLLHFREITFLDISSTKIRESIRKGESVRYLVPLEVEAHIRKHGLYRKKAEGTEPREGTSYP